MSSVEASSTESEEDAGFDSPAQEDEFDAPLAKDRGVANIHTDQFSSPLHDEERSRKFLEDEHEALSRTLLSLSIRTDAEIARKAVPLILRYQLGKTT